MGRLRGNYKVYRTNSIQRFIFCSLFVCFNIEDEVQLKVMDIIERKTTLAVINIFHSHY